MKPKLTKIIGISLTLLLLLNVALVSLVLTNASALKKQEASTTVHATESTTTAPEIPALTMVKTGTGNIHLSFRDEDEWGYREHLEWDWTLENLTTVSIGFDPNPGEMGPPVYNPEFCAFTDTFFSTPLELYNISEKEAKKISYRYVVSCVQYLLYFAPDGRVVFREYPSDTYYISRDNRFQPHLLSQVLDSCYSYS